MKGLQVLIIVVCLLFSACSKQETILKIEKGVSKELADYRKQNISQLEYQLSFDIPENQKENILGKNQIIFQLKATDQDLQIDFREDPNLIKSLSCNGKKSAYRFESEHLIIPKSELKKGGNSIEIEFTAGNSSLNRNKEFLYTLFVPDRARTAFPCFDQPNLKASFKLDLSIPKTWKAIANGKLDASKTIGDKRFYSFSKTKALPTYLFSFVAGKFKTITRTHKGREHTLFHRETDKEKMELNTPIIFDLLFQSLDWLEDYTDVPYPFAKYDIIAIPSFQYGGMEHTGATLYKASTLFLDKDATQNRILKRANLIAHETAHMWFGDLVTMKWFDQVWLKEVFANFLADKITNPSFPDINHKLKFQMAHFPSSFSVDRTTGANPINQQLENLKDAGTLYGSIIYHKSPIVMNMLENISGEKALQKALQNYLKTYAYSNASWEDLISILDKTTAVDLKKWSSVWVDQTGRPHIETKLKTKNGAIAELSIIQKDADGNIGEWNQDLELVLAYADDIKRMPISLKSQETIVSEATAFKIPNFIIPNGAGNAYAFFKLDENSKSYLLQNMNLIQDDLIRGIAWINLFENLREGYLKASDFVAALEKHLSTETNTLVLERMLTYLSHSYWLDLSTDERKQINSKLEQTLWMQISKENDMGRKSSLFSCLNSISESRATLNQLFHIWKEKIALGGLKLSEAKSIALACNLAIKMPEKADYLIQTQTGRIRNSDRKKRMKFVALALSPDQTIRANFFKSLENPENREHEPWVCEGLRYLHHPLRQKEALNYLPNNLNLLKEIQETGDIFFPKQWLDACYGGHNSKEAGDITQSFLDQHPDYPENLKLKILQSAHEIIK